MEKKLIIGVIVIVLIGIVFIVNYVQDTPKLEMAKLPPIYLEATVLSLDKDSATINIDKISSEHKLVDCVIMETRYPAPKEGDEITVPFYYSTGPAIIRTVPLADVGDSNIDKDASSSDVGVSSPDEVQRQEGEYFVTIIESSAVDEIQEEILPGLEEGSKFKTTIYSSCVTDINIYKYKLI